MSVPFCLWNASAAPLFPLHHRDSHFAAEIVPNAPFFSLSRPLFLLGAMNSACALVHDERGFLASATFALFFLLLDAFFPARAPGELTPSLFLPQSKIRTPPLPKRRHAPPFHEFPPLLLFRKRRASFPPSLLGVVVCLSARAGCKNQLPLVPFLLWGGAATALFRLLVAGFRLSCRKSFL